MVGVVVMHNCCEQSRRWGESKPPPIDRTALALTYVNVTVRDEWSRKELGYTGKVTREQGLQEMRKQYEAGQTFLRASMQMR
jgi:hypothetical protein